VNNLNKKEILSDLRDYLYHKLDNYNTIKDVKISSFRNPLLIETVKTLNVIELDNIESFSFYLNYDHYLIFKLDNEYYFCDTELVPSLGINSMLRIIDYNLYLRKDKMKKIGENSFK